MSRRVGAGSAVVILVATVLVAVGVGQGSPPPRLAISRAAELREVAAVAHAGSTVRQGEDLFSDHGCNACHTMAAGGYGGRLGPRLDVVTQDEPLGVIEAHITAPPDDDPHYEAGLMPENFGSRLSRHDLQALAAYVYAAGHAAVGKARSRS